MFIDMVLLRFSCSPDNVLLVQVPRDPEDPQGAERQKEEQRLIDDAEPLNEEEAAEKEQLLQEVTSICLCCDCSFFSLVMTAGAAISRSNEEKKARNSRRAREICREHFAAKK